MHKDNAKLGGRISILGLTTLTLATATNIFAGAYQLPREYNVVEIGNGGSGGAAIVSDASTAYANPGGLTLIPKPQLVFSGVPIFIRGRFVGSNTWDSATLPAFTQTSKAAGNVQSLIPAFHFAMPLNYNWLPQNRWSLGFSMVSPFGLFTRYANGSVIRYSGTISKIQVVDLSPDLAYRINDQFSAGVGVDFERISIDLRQMIGAPPISTTLDTSSKNTANGWGYGWHGGILYQMNPATRFGLTYHSQVSSRLGGVSTLSGPLMTALFDFPGTQVSNNSFTTKVNLPASTVLSAYHDVNAQWAVMASAYFTQWGSINNIQTGNNVAGLPPGTAISVGIPLHYRNTWLLALGGSYRLNMNWLFRAGVSFDQSPVKSAYRNVTLPDSDKVGLSIGAHYDVSQLVSLDAGWMHLFAHDANVSTTLVTGTQMSTAVGKYSNNNADLIGLQANLMIP